ncbi:Homeodomain-like protein [Zopfochytrium polystomum]|nr:Homeodomain-like protein [Zopfochytrium polystomum]
MADFLQMPGPLPVDIHQKLMTDALVRYLSLQKLIDARQDPENGSSTMGNAELMDLQRQLAEAKRQLDAVHMLSGPITFHPSPALSALPLDTLSQAPSPAISHTSTENLQSPFPVPAFLIANDSTALVTPTSMVTPASSLPSSPNPRPLAINPPSATIGLGGLASPPTVSPSTFAVPLSALSFRPPREVGKTSRRSSSKKNAARSVEQLPAASSSARPRAAEAAEQPKMPLSAAAEIVLRPQPASYNKWTPEEDALLRRAVAMYGPHGRWAQVAAHVPKRTPIQCSTRWTGALNSTIHKGKWSAEEDAQLLRGYRAETARLRRKAAELSSGADDSERKDRNGSSSSDDEINWSSIADRVPGRTAVQCIARYQEALDPSIRKGKWSPEEDELLRVGMATHGKSWVKIAEMVPGRTQRQCRTRWLQMRQRLEKEMQSA